jgi:hypothetical protein
VNKDFIRGDVIEWCGDRYIVLDNHGRNGYVIPFTENATTEYINSESFRLYWTYQGSDSVKVDHVKID